MIPYFFARIPFRAGSIICRIFTMYSMHIVLGNYGICSSYLNKDNKNMCTTEDLMLTGVSACDCEGDKVFILKNYSLLKLI